MRGREDKFISINAGVTSKNSSCKDENAKINFQHIYRGGEARNFQGEQVTLSSLTKAPIVAFYQ